MILRLSLLDSAHVRDRRLRSSQRAKVTPAILQGVHHRLPQLKLEFAEIHAPKYPHLVDQLELLADVIEDYAEGADQEIPYFVIAEASFALARA